VDDRLSAQGLNPTHREGYNSAEWVLLDYVDFVVHVFSETARKFYDLERLWKTATRLELSDLEKPARAPAKKTVPRKTAAKPSARSGAKKSAAKKSTRARRKS
jgi:ribosome-associated protein